MKDLLARDFSDTGKCNYYTTRDTYLQSPSVMLIQVSILVSYEFLNPSQASTNLMLCRRTVHTPRTLTGWFWPLRRWASWGVFTTKMWETALSVRHGSNCKNHTKCWATKHTVSGWHSKRICISVSCIPIIEWLEGYGFVNWFLSRLSDIGGMLMLLATGLAGSCLAFVVEIIMRGKK